MSNMNVIRTAAIELSVIPAIAYKQKLASGGAGIKLQRLDRDAAASYTFNKRSGSLVPYGTVNAELFPEAAVEEALELTEGLPYSSRGKIKVTAFEEAPSPEETPAKEASTMIGTDEYRAIVDHYTDEQGKLNYRLMNKDFIQFASRSKIVADMVAQQASTSDIITHIVKNRAAYLAEKKESLDDEQILALIDTLEEIDPRSAFKELRMHLRRMLARK